MKPSLPARCQGLRLTGERLDGSQYHGGDRRISTSTRPHTNLFREVDRTEDPDFFVRFMDEAQKPPAIQASKHLMLERAALTSGEAVLDVGCGPGDDLFDMAERVGPAGRLVGLDASEVMVGSHLVALQTNGALRPDEAERWWEHLRRSAAAGTLLIGFTAFVVVGAKR